MRWNDGSIGDMVRSAWRRGYRTGLFEGFLLGAIVALAVVFVRFAL